MQKERAVIQVEKQAAQASQAELEQLMQQMLQQQQAMQQQMQEQQAAHEEQMRRMTELVQQAQMQRAECGEVKEENSALRRCCEELQHIKQVYDEVSSQLLTSQQLVDENAKAVQNLEQALQTKPQNNFQKSIAELVRCSKEADQVKLQRDDLKRRLESVEQEFERKLQELLTLEAGSDADQRQGLAQACSWGSLHRGRLAHCMLAIQFDEARSKLAIAEQQHKEHDDQLRQHSEDWQKALELLRSCDGENKLGSCAEEAKDTGEGKVTWDSSASTAISSLPVHVE